MAATTRKGQKMEWQLTFEKNINQNPTENYGTRKIYGTTGKFKNLTENAHFIFLYFDTHIDPMSSKVFYNDRTFIPAILKMHGREFLLIYSNTSLRYINRRLSGKMSSYNKL